MNEMNETHQKSSYRRKARAEALAQLDSLDKEIPENPGRFTLLKKSESEEDFKNFFDDTFKKTPFKVGEVVKGKILKITDGHVVVDINYKSEGVIPRSEFHKLKEQENFEVGQTVEVYIEQIEDKNGLIVLSKDKANIKKIWQDIMRVKDNDEVIEGKVVSTVKGGLNVDIGVKAFLPGSQLDIRPIRKLDPFIGKTMDFKILKANPKRGNVVLSRRAIVEQERESLPKATDIKEGSVVRGIVKNITDYGAFIDLGDRDGLLHITDISWSRIEHPKSVLRMGQDLDLQVLKIDQERNRISLGLKQLNEDNWEKLISNYSVGSVVKAKVSSIADYGAFMSIDEGGLEGLVHINEISWTRKVKHPSHILKVGQELEVKIIDIKRENHKLALSIKQTQDNPWLKLKDKYSVGEVGEFEVVSISDFGLFVKVDEGLDGLVRVSDISWTENVNPFEKYKVGDKVKAKVLDIHPEAEKFSLGIKQLDPDPWASIEDKYSVGSRHEVKVVRVVDFGAFVKIKDNIEGLIHISELSKKRVTNPQDVVKVGDKVTAEIVNVDKDAKKIGLSIRLVETHGSQTKSAGQSQKSKTGFMESFFAKALKKSMNLEETSGKNQVENQNQDNKKVKDQDDDKQVEDKGNK